MEDLFYYQKLKAAMESKADTKKAAKIFDADLLDKGEYFFPRQGQADFKLDLSITPVMKTRYSS